MRAYGRLPTYKIPASKEWRPCPFNDSWEDEADAHYAGGPLAPHSRLLYLGKAVMRTVSPLCRWLTINGIIQRPYCYLYTSFVTVCQNPRNYGSLVYPM